MVGDRGGWPTTANTSWPAGVPLDDQARQRLGQTVFTRCWSWDRWSGIWPILMSRSCWSWPQQAFVLRAAAPRNASAPGSGRGGAAAFAARTVAVAGRRLDEANPKADARLPDGSRLHAICHP